MMKRSSFQFDLGKGNQSFSKKVRTLEQPAYIFASAETPRKQLPPQCLTAEANLQTREMTATAIPARPVRTKDVSTRELYSKINLAISAQPCNHTFSIISSVSVALCAIIFDNYTPHLSIDYFLTSPYLFLGLIDPLMLP